VPNAQNVPRRINPGTVVSKRIHVVKLIKSTSNYLFTRNALNCDRKREKEARRERISKSLASTTHSSPLSLGVFSSTARTEKTEISADSAFYTVGCASCKQVKKLSGCLYIRRFIKIQYILFTQSSL